MNINSSTIPVSLTIAGSDNSGGAGIQADLKTFAATGTYGCSAVTCVVSEIPGAVNQVLPMPADLVADQIHILPQGFPIHAVKTGMLFSSEIIETVAKEITHLRALYPELRFVVDPVMIASSGDPLLQPDAIQCYWDQIFPLADLVTPNLDEAATLLGSRITSFSEMQSAAHALAAKLNCAVLLKGGHLKGDTAIDLLASPDSSLQQFDAPYFHNVDTHGTGCTYSAAITSFLAQKHSLPEAVQKAKSYITQSIRQHFQWETPTHLHTTPDSSPAAITTALNHFPS